MKLTVFVASPSATGRIPVASGSSVPACPAFIPVVRFSLVTTRLDVMPAGLSMTSQPPRPASNAILVPQIALDGLAVEQRGDTLGLVKGPVERKAQIRHVPQPDEAGDLSLQAKRAAPQTRNDFGGLGAAARHDGRCGGAQ